MVFVEMCPWEETSGVGRGKEWTGMTLGWNKEIVHGSGARKLIGGHSRPGAKCVYMHGVVGPPGAPGVGELARSGGMDR